jgi:hypothetical protein
MIISMKNSNDTIENRTGDLPACNAVPQPTAPSCALYLDKWEKNIKLNLQEVGCGGIDLAKDTDIWRTLVNAVMNFRIP